MIVWVLSFQVSEIENSTYIDISQNFDPEIRTHSKSNSACDHDHGNSAQDNFGGILFGTLRTCFINGFDLIGCEHCKIWQNLAWLARRESSREGKRRGKLTKVACF